MKSTKTTAMQTANNLVCSNQFGTFFGLPQEVFNRTWRQLEEPDGNSAIYISMEIGAEPDVFHPLLNFMHAKGINTSNDPKTKHLIQKYLHGPRKIPNYSGGLGVLAGDTLKSFADLHIPVTAVSLMYRKGYFSQFVDSKVGQIDQQTLWNPEKTPTLFRLFDPDNPELPLAISVPFYNGKDEPESIKAEVWMKMEISENLDFFIPEFLIDYSLPASPTWIKEAADQLYCAKTTTVKANQRRMLGSCVLPLMQTLGFTARTIHLNEQHGIAVTIELILRDLKEKLDSNYQLIACDNDIKHSAENVAKRIVYTIHTPVKAGHDRFSKEMYRKISSSLYRRILNLLAEDDESPGEYNFTSLAMRVNRAVNSVSRLHRDVTRNQFPEISDKITAVTNGVHHLTWISDNRSEVFDSIDQLDGWRDDPGVFANLPDKSYQLTSGLQKVWDEDNRTLIDYINNMLVRHRKQMQETWIDPPNYLSRLSEVMTLKPGVFSFGFARRFSTYKRADLIFDDIDTLSSILIKNNWPVNFIFSGKAHPADEPGKSVLKLLLKNQQKLFEKSNGLAKLVFIPGYDMLIAKMMVSGVHAWLNSPKRPLEASGTSGMKAALNGVPNISVMDGWWVEGYHEGQTGWKFGFEGAVNETNLSESPDSLLYTEDSTAFYKLLPEVLSMFYENHDKYLEIGVNNLRLNIPIFNTHRMAAEYVKKYDLPLDKKTADRVKHFQHLYKSDLSTANR